MTSRISKCVVAAAALAFACTASATLVNYSLGTWSQQFPGPVAPPAGSPHVVDGWGYPGDTVTLDNGTGQINLADGASGTMSIGTLRWGVDYTYNGTATAWDYPANWPDLTFAINAIRSITIGTGVGSISQNGTLKATWNDDYLSLSAGPVSSVLVLDGSQWYRVDITPQALPIATVLVFGSGNPPDGGFQQSPRPMEADYTVTAVPEPTTVLAGALLLLPFGVSTVRFFRKPRAA